MVTRRDNHKDLVLWQKSMDLAVAIHELTQTLPRIEVFGLSSQLRRAAVSVASNIAEGTARRTTKEFIAFLHIARGSLAELETQASLAARVGYVSATDLQPIQDHVDEVGRILNAVITGLRQRVKQRSALSPIP